MMCNVPSDDLDVVLINRISKRFHKIFLTFTVTRWHLVHKEKKNSWLLHLFFTLCGGKASYSRMNV